MCIAVNEKGQAHKAFAIKIEGNSICNQTSKSILHLDYS